MSRKVGRRGGGGIRLLTNRPRRIRFVTSGPSASRRCGLRLCLMPVGAAEREKLAQTLRQAGFATRDALPLFLSLKLFAALILATSIGLWAMRTETLGQHSFLVGVCGRGRACGRKYRTGVPAARIGGAALAEDVGRFVGCARSDDDVPRQRAHLRAFAGDGRRGACADRT